LLGDSNGIPDLGYFGIPNAPVHHALASVNRATFGQFAL
jgi:hypothetical protein